jgi:hypothetical protein
MGLWLLIALVVIVVALTTWRVEIARYRNARPAPRHVRARGEQRTFPIEPASGGDETT